MKQIALISGGTSGIGFGIAAKFLNDGFKVYTFGRSAAKAQAAMAKMANDDFVAFALDATSKQLPETLAAHLTEGYLTCLVNAAGVFKGGRVEEETPELFQEVMNINLNSAYALTHACLPLLQKGEGANIINISSVHGMCLSNRMVENMGYSVSKAGMDMMTNRLAAMLAPDNIRVNSINPGLVATPIWEGAEDIRDQIVAETTGLGRVGQPEDIADAAAYLASASWVTGLIMNVDGGYMVTK